MLFGKKNKVRCLNCKSKIEKKFSYCSECGYPQKETSKNFGLLGESDFDNSFIEEQPFGLTDKIINSLMSSVMKSLDKQFKSFDQELEKNFQNAEIKSLPNGIRIKIASPNFAQKKQKKKSILEKSPNQNQIKKLSSLPRTSAKSSMKRLNNTINYELSTPGVSSTEDIFVSKLEDGYEIKAIGDKKIYVNSLPINLPLKSLSLLNNKLFVEFKTEDN